MKKTCRFYIINMLWQLNCSSFYSSVLNGNHFAEDESKERAERAAAAARRWREYSRKGVDKPPKFKLPEAEPSKDK